MLADTFIILNCASSHIFQSQELLLASPTPFMITEHFLDLVLKCTPLTGHRSLLGLVFS